MSGDIRVFLTLDVLDTFVVVSDKEHYRSENYRRWASGYLSTSWPAVWSVYEVNVDLFRVRELRIGVDRISGNVVAWLLVDGEPARWCADFSRWHGWFRDWVRYIETRGEA
jgi:hypothetical protein